MQCTGDKYKILSIPIVSPDVTRIKIEECGEELIDLNNLGNKRIVLLTSFDSTYNAGHRDCGKVRKGLCDRLLRLLEHLPSNVGLAIFEGYRPLWKQKEYFVKKFKELARIDKDFKLDDEHLNNIYRETCKWVSPFIDNIPVHCTGAAIDFMLFQFNEEGFMELLDLGKFGVIFGPNDQAKTLAPNLSAVQIANRNMLLNAASESGLVNYGYEWWHYSYGDRAWAFVEGREKAIYGIAGTSEFSVEEYSKESFLKSMIENTLL
jgi:zinc D-Ala-D-Ala dipeptidase